MVNINCTSSCEYQKDGKCMMTTPSAYNSFNGKCIYFMPKNKTYEKK